MSGVTVLGKDLAWNAGEITLVDIVLTTVVIRSTESRMLSIFATTCRSMTTTSMFRRPVARSVSDEFAAARPLASKCALIGDAAKVADSNREN